MQLGEGEPAAGPWRVAPVAELLELVAAAGGTVTGRPLVVAVDGRGGGGKSTLARRLTAAVPASSTVHTDDVAWHHSFFDWHDLLATGVLEPLRRGEPVRYRPPGWVAKDRPGAVEVDAGLDLVVVEGVGAGRRELSHLVDAVVWVQSDAVAAQARALVRDVAQGDRSDLEEATAFWHEWMAEELPFQQQQRPWERACAVVAGTPQEALGRPDVVLGPQDVVLAPTPRRPARNAFTAGHSDRTTE